MKNLGSISKRRHITLQTRVHMVKAMVFLEVLYKCELDHKECRALKNWCFQTVALEKTLESPLDSKEIKPVNPKGNQPWIFIGRLMLKPKLQYWPSDAKSRLTGKHPEAGKDWGQEWKGATEDEMVRWHHRLNGHEFEQTLGDDGGQEILAHCSLWGCKKSDTIERLNNNKKYWGTFKIPNLQVTPCIN